MILVFTGKGKGKTCAALGIALRAAGADQKVLIVQFLKSGESSENQIVGEIEGLQLKSFGRKGFFVSRSDLKENPRLEQKGIDAFTDQDKKLANQGLEFARNEADHYDIVILDEINVALHYNLLQEDEVLNFLRDTDSEIILTGRHCPPAIKEKADLVTEMKEIKHYYNQGQGPIKGIDL